LAPTAIDGCSSALARYLFFPAAGSAGLAGAETKDDVGAAGFFACFGFFFSRLLRC
jgi:hypothetical protein